MHARKVKPTLIRYVAWLFKHRRMLAGRVVEGPMTGVTIALPREGGIG